MPSNLEDIIKTKSEKQQQQTKQDGLRISPRNSSVIMENVKQQRYTRW